MTDGELLDQIAFYGVEMDEADIHECLRLANEVFCGRKFSQEDRAYAEKLLERLKAKVAT